MNKAKGKKLRYLNYKCNEYNISQKVCAGIYEIESMHRNIIFRIAENSATLVGLILNYTFRVPLKNYTIGCCQIGISSILYLSGFYSYEHITYIEKLTLKEVLIIIKSMYYKNNIDLLCKKISLYYKKYKYLHTVDELQAAAIIGQLYNGKYIYGLQLQEIVRYSQSHG